MTAQLTDQQLAALPLVRTSERTTYTRCGFKWQLAYLERIGRPRKGNALVFGSLVHTALEAFYVPGKKRGTHPVKTFLTVYDELSEAEGYDFTLRDEEKEWVEARVMGEELLEDYVDHWREEDKCLEVVAPEMAMMSVIRDGRGKPMARYLSQVDMVVWHNGLGRHLFFDHKTASSIPDPVEKDLDEQAGTYWALGPPWLRENGYIGEDVDVEGFYFNWIRKANRDERPTNAKGQALNKPKKADLIRGATEDAFLDESTAKKLKVTELEDYLTENGLDPEQYGQPSKVQPAERFKRHVTYRSEVERELTYKRIQQQLWEMDLRKRGKLPIYKVPQYGGILSCRGCEFFDLCLMHEAGQDYEDLIGLEYVNIDPYEQYREENLFTEEND